MTTTHWLRAAFRRENLPYIAAFAIIYLVWGSTFLVIRVGVADLPPLLFAGIRALLAGALLLLLALQRSEHLPRTRRQLAFLAFFAVAMIIVPSGSSTYALKNLPSNEVALLNASLALWVVYLGTLGPLGQKLSVRSTIGLLCGFVGVALLVWPHEAVPAGHVGWQLLVLCGCLAWSIGTVLYRNTLLGLGPIAFNACIMLLGGLGLVGAGMAHGDLAQWHWNARGVYALIYLAVIGSAVAYTAYAWLLKNARTDRVATFAYVNPAIATLLGWLVLDETLTPLQMAGTLVILGSVALVTLPTRIA